MSEFTFSVKKEEDKEEKKAPAAEGEDGDDGDDGPAPEEESTATFAPVVQLQEIEVKTMEEEEEVLYKARGKLYIFGETLLDKGTGNKTWRERGLGDIKLLKHRESTRIRVLMRQEKTMKIIVNSFLDPRIALVPNAGSDRSWVWVSFDFAEGELIETTFAIKFGAKETADEYKVAFTDGQKEMEKLMAGLDSKEGGKEADDAAEALESLGVKDKSESAPETEAPAAAPTTDA